MVRSACSGGETEEDDGGIFNCKVLEAGAMESRAQIVLFFSLVLLATYAARLVDFRVD